MTTPQENSSSSLWRRKLQDLELEIGERQFRQSVVKDGNQLAIQCFELAETLGIVEMMKDINTELLGGGGDVDYDFSRAPNDLPDEVWDDSTEHVYFALRWEKVDTDSLFGEGLPGGMIEVTIEILLEEGTLRVGRIFVGEHLMRSPGLPVIQDALLRELRNQLEM